MTQRSQVVLFLHEVKKAVRSAFHMVPRKKNLDALARLGLRVEDAKNIVLGLTPANYSSGPETNRVYPNQDVWVFGEEVDGEELYIKLVIQRASSTACVCISFHECDKPLTYPYKGS